MDKIPGGYIIVARKTVNSELMDKPPHYFKLWVWMLLQANWKDRDKLKRGQFMTTIAEMQKAGGYKIGYRVRPLTKDEVRSAYEAFTKATMITTTKTTRGMIITICNYDLYQNPDNYEAHTEHHDENTALPTPTPHDTEEGLRIEEKESKKEDYAEPCSSHPFSFILKNGKQHVIPEAKISEWENLYDSVNVRKELQKLAEWCVGHASQRKTESGANKFVCSWLNRAEKNGRNRIAVESQSIFDRELEKVRWTSAR